MGGQPWLKFYPADWRADPALRMCGFAARGLWIEILSIMHEATPRGHLVVNGKAVSTRQLASLVGGQEFEVAALLAELESAGVFSTKKNGVIFSRRMESDENKSRKLRENGKLGGNPSLRKEKIIAALDNQEDNTQKPEARIQIPEDAPSGASGAPPERDDFEILEEKLRAAAGEAINTAHPGFVVLAEPTSWIVAGCDLDLDILPVVAGLSAKHRGRPIGSWKYFTEAIFEARDRRRANIGRATTDFAPGGRGQGPPARPPHLRDEVKALLRKDSEDERQKDHTVLDGECVRHGGVGRS